MEYVLCIKNNLPTSLCHEIIDKFENDDRKHEGTVGEFAIVNKSVKTSTDLHITNLESWKDIDSQLSGCLKKGLEQYQKHLIGLLTRRAYHPTEIHDISNLVNMGLLFKTVDTGFQIQRISKDGKYIWHHDSCPGQKRNVAFIWYLNTLTEDEGGSTDFCDKSVQPEEGKLIFFPATWTYIHTGRRVLTEKSKYIITGFICDNSM